MTVLFGFKNPEAMRRWLGDPEGQEFLAHLHDWQQQKQKSLRSADEVLKIGRFQGNLEILDRLLSLREELANAVVQKG